MATPGLSIGLPLYNEERYLPCSLDSLLTGDFIESERGVSVYGGLLLVAVLLCRNVRELIGWMWGSHNG